jgi:Ala-tRNA(Pro) deacylase
MAAPDAELAALEARLPAAPLREEAVYARLRALGIAWKTYEHVPVFTVEQSQSLRGVVPGSHTKNLFLKDRRDGLWLVVTRENARIDLKALAKQMGQQRFSFGSGELLVEILGVPPGSVTPFALMNDAPPRVTVILDEKMMAKGLLNFHPLRNDRTTAIAASDLVRFIRATDHEPRILALPEVAP